MTLKDLPIETPRAWEDFILFYKKILERSGVTLTAEDFLKLPFEMQFGIFASFFLENGLDIDVQRWDEDVLQSSICDTFRVQENMMGHFS